MKDPKDQTIKLFLSFMFGTIYITITTIIFSNDSSIPFKGFAGAVYVGLFEMGITFVLWSKALSLSETTAKVSRFVYLTPFLSLVLIHFIVGEEIFISSLIGLVLIITGIVIEQTVKKQINP